MYNLEKGGAINDYWSKNKRNAAGQNLTQDELAARIHTTKQTIHKYENGIITNIPSSKIEAIANALNTTPDYLMGWETKFSAPEVTEDTVIFPVIGEIAAGYDYPAYEDWSGETVEIPKSYLHGRSRDDFFVLSVKGDSMYPSIWTATRC